MTTNSPYIAAFEEATKKHHIHKYKLTIGQEDSDGEVIFQVQVTPHRSKGGVHLVFLFSTSRMVGVAKPMVRVEVQTWSNDYECNAGALADTMMLIAELTSIWTAIAEGVSI